MPVFICVCVCVCLSVCLCVGGGGGKNIYSLLMSNPVVLPSTSVS